MSRFRQIYFSLHGRLSRRDFWILGVVPASGLVLAANLMFNVEPPLGFIALVLVPLILLPIVAISVKRWHDIDLSGWWVLIGLVPYVGWIIVILFNGFSSGTIGRNRYGPDPIREFPDPEVKAL